MTNYKLFIYTLFIMFSIFNNNVLANQKVLFDFKINSINGEEIKLSKFKGKTLLLVNVASKCGFTNQYSELQKLYELYKDKGLVVIGIPSNQFGGQEPESESKIKNFCETNFNITFPMTGKYEVKGKNSHPIYVWAKDTFGNSTVPKWNFHKILINKKGIVEDTFVSFTNPLSKKILKKIEEIL
jgi:glutathione peroxidase